MKKIIKTVALGAIAAVMFSSCAGTKNTSSRTALDLPGLTLERSDYKLVDDMEADAEVKVTFGIFYKGIDKKNLKVGSFGGWASSSMDERMAVFNLIEANPEIDYVTNVRVLKTYKQGFLGITKTYKTKVIAKGLIIKTDK